MIKGHAVIELKDTKTGQVSRIEHDNMLTNGLQNALLPVLGRDGYAQSSNQKTTIDGTLNDRKTKNRSIMNHLLGGIFLFENPLEENAAITEPPKGNQIIGKGSWDAYSGIDTSRGSYSDSESGMQEDGSYRHVWNFGTNQANGQISALALTTYAGGANGEGFKAYDKTQNKEELSALLYTGEDVIKDTGLNYQLDTTIAFSDYAKNKVYFSKDSNDLNASLNGNGNISETGKINLLSAKVPLSKISPFYDYYNSYIQEELEIDVPEEYKNYVVSAKSIKKGNCKYSCSVSNQYVYIEPEYEINANEDFKILRINKTTLEMDVISLRNTTTNKINCMKCCTDDYLYVRGITEGNGPCVHRISLSTGEIKTSEILSVETLDSTFPSAYKAFFAGNRIYLWQQTTVFASMDPETLKYNNYYERITTTNNVLNEIDFKKIEHLNENLYLIHWLKNETNYNRYRLRGAVLANSVMTVNNLEVPVIKTAEQSMKITYTISEAQ